MDSPIFGTKIVRLKGGEDLIAGVVEGEDGKLILDNPLHLIFKRSEAGMMMVLLPWLPMELIEENLAIIDKQEVLTFVEPKMKLIDYYNNVLETIKKKLIDIEQNPLDYNDDTQEEDEDISQEELEELTKLERTLH